MKTFNEFINESSTPYNDFLKGKKKIGNKYIIYDGIYFNIDKPTGDYVFYYDGNLPTNIIKILRNKFEASVERDKKDKYTITLSPAYAKNIDSITDTLISTIKT